MCGDTPIGVNLSGSKGRCSLETPSLSRLEPSAPSEKEKKRGFWGHPKPRQGEPCTPWGRALPLSCCLWGTPQTPAGRTLHPLGKGVALKLLPMGDTPNPGRGTSVPLHL